MVAKTKAIKPQRLREGDSVAALTLSWGGPNKFPHVYKYGVKTLTERLGLRVEEYPMTKSTEKEIHSHPERRAEDLNEAFRNPKIKAIISTIGGDDSIRILKYVDPKLIKSNPKIVMGFSDTTITTAYCNQLGLVTFNGPSIMAGFSQFDTLPKDYEAHVRDILFDPKPTYTYKPFKNYSDGMEDWSKTKNLGKIKEPKKQDGWHWLQGENVAKGILFGGCLDVLEFMKGTEYWPRSDFWDEKILFLETSNDKPSPELVKWWLRNYGIQGIFDKVAGLVFAIPMNYTKEEKKELETNIITVVAKEFGRSDIPIVANMDFGHTSPQFIMPLGIKAEINCAKQTFKLLEAPVK